MEEYTLEELRELKKKRQEKSPVKEEIQTDQETYSREEYLKIKHQDERK